MNTIYFLFICVLFFYLPFFLWRHSKTCNSTEIHQCNWSHTSKHRWTSKGKNNSGIRILTLLGGLGNKTANTHLYRARPSCAENWVSYMRLPLEIEFTFLPWQHSILDPNHSALHCYLLFPCHSHSCIFMWSPKISSSIYFRWLSVS